MKTSSTNIDSNQNTTTEHDFGVPATTAADLGYDEPAAEPSNPAPVIPPVPPVTPKKDEPAAPVEQVTGYKKPDEPATPPVEQVTGYKKPDEPATSPVEPTKEDEPNLEKEIETAVSTLGDGYDKKKITEFALKNKLTKEQVDAYVSQIKADEAIETKAREERVKAQRAEWTQELFKDPEFGGENFDKSIHEVETLVGNLFPNTKKVLTEKKGMLPPYFMKDLLAVAKALKPTNQFVGGEPPAPAEETTSFLDDMYT